MPQKSDRILNVGDLEVRDRPVGCEGVHYRFGGAEQFQLNAVLARPMLQKNEHSESPTADRIDLGKIQRDNPRIVLRLDGVAKFEDRLAMDHPASTFYDCQVRKLLNAYGQHGRPPQVLR